MYLKSLTLKGFKSFADRSVLSLEPGVTAIVGPNGSGKSNISDSVLWVLGERNAKNLRGQVMEDVIFAGSSARKSVGVAEVELVLDNSDGSLPVDYEEVSIGRRMYRNGESEYLINGVQARRMDVLDILHDSGLGTGTYSIISQGNLDSILQSKPEDRRALIEEAAGTLKHKQRKAKSERRIEAMEQHVSRVKDVVAEIERQLGPLERKAKRAVAFKELSAQLNDLSLQLAVDDVRILRDKWSAIVASEEAAVADLEQKKQAITKAEAASNACQELIRSGSESVALLARKHSSVSSYSDRFDAQVVLFQEKLRQSKVRIAEIEASLLDGIARKEALSGEVQELKTQLDALKDQVAAAKASLNAAELAHAESTRVLSTLERDVFKCQQDRRDTENEEQRIRMAHAKATEQLSIAQGRAELWAERLAAAQERKEQAQTALDQASESFTSLQNDYDIQSARYAKAKDASRAAKQGKLDADAAARELEEQDRKLRARILSLEEIERQILAAKSPAAAWAGSHEDFNLQPLVHSFKVEAGYETLVETLLGEDLSLLLAQDFAEVENLRDALQSNNLEGTVLLLLNSAALPSEALHAEDIKDFNAVLLSDHIGCSQEMRPFVQRAFGSVLVFDTFEAAAEAYIQGTVTATFATRDGEMITCDGKVVLGHSKKTQESGALQRAQELDALHESQRESAVAVQAAQEKAEAAAAAYAQAQEEELDASREYARVSGNASAAEKEIILLKKRVETSEKELHEVEARNAEINATIKETQPKVDSLAEQMKAATDKVIQAKAALTAAQQAVAPARETEAKAARKLADEKLAYAMLAERETYSARVIAAREDELTNLENAKKNNDESLVIQRCITQRALPLIQSIELIAAAARARACALEEESKQVQSSSFEIHERAQSAQQGVYQAREALDAANETLSSLRIEKGRLEVQVESAVSVLDRDFETPVEVALELPALDDRQAVENDVFAIKRKIANMGTINPDAAEEYEELKVRFDYLNGQLNDLVNARAALRKIDAIIDARMRDSFASTFQAANENFKEIFAVLFPGGTGELVLDNPDDIENSGIEVIAQPRGKKISKMTLMSGGEKSLIALALLFAVYRIRTTPFYILDEVEAALDDTNLRRLIAYLNDLRDTTQLIMITHQRRTMEMADVLFGVSMQADGVTKVMSQRLEHALSYAE